jgi:hypothetical protein
VILVWMQMRHPMRPSSSLPGSWRVTPVGPLSRKMPRVPHIHFVTAHCGRSSLGNALVKQPTSLLLLLR